MNQLWSVLFVFLVALLAVSGTAHAAADFFSDVKILSYDSYDPAQDIFFNILFGNKGSSGDHTALFVDFGDGHSDTFPIDFELMPGQVLPLHLSHRYSRAGTFAVTVSIDPQGLIAEANEENNAVTRSVVLLEKTYTYAMDPSSKSVAYQIGTDIGSEPTDKTITFTVRNTGNQDLELSLDEHASIVSVQGRRIDVSYDSLRVSPGAQDTFSYTLNGLSAAKAGVYTKILVFRNQLGSPTSVPLEVQVKEPASYAFSVPQIPSASVDAGSTQKSRLVTIDVDNTGNRQATFYLNAPAAMQAAQGQSLPLTVVTGEVSVAAGGTGHLVIRIDAITADKQGSYAADLTITNHEDPKQVSITRSLHLDVHAIEVPSYTFTVLLTDDVFLVGEDIGPVPRDLMKEVYVTNTGNREITVSLVVPAAVYAEDADRIGIISAPVTLSPEETKALPLKLRDVSSTMKTYTGTLRFSNLQGVTVENPYTLRQRIPDDTGDSSGMPRPDNMTNGTTDPSDFSNSTANSTMGSGSASASGNMTNGTTDPSDFGNSTANSTIGSGSGSGVTANNNTNSSTNPSGPANMTNDSGFGNATNSSYSDNATNSSAAGSVYGADVSVTTQSSSFSIASEEVQPQTAQVTFMLINNETSQAGVTLLVPATVTADSGQLMLELAETNVVVDAQSSKEVAISIQNITPQKEGNYTISVTVQSFTGNKTANILFSVLKQAASLEISDAPFGYPEKERGEPISGSILVKNAADRALQNITVRSFGGYTFSATSFDLSAGEEMNITFEKNVSRTADAGNYYEPIRFTHPAFASAYTYAVTYHVPSKLGLGRIQYEMDDERKKTFSSDIDAKPKSRIVLFITLENLYPRTGSRSDHIRLDDIELRIEGTGDIDADVLESDAEIDAGKEVTVELELDELAADIPEGSYTFNLTAMAFDTQGIMHRAASVLTVTVRKDRHGIGLDRIVLLNDRVLEGDFPTQLDIIIDNLCNLGSSDEDLTLSFSSSSLSIDEEEEMTLEENERCLRDTYPLDLSSAPVGMHTLQVTLSGDHIDTIRKTVSFEVLGDPDHEFGDAVTVLAADASSPEAIDPVVRAASTEESAVKQEWIEPEVLLAGLLLSAIIIVFGAIVFMVFRMLRGY